MTYRFLLVTLALGLLGSAASEAVAQVTPAQRKEIAAISRDLTKAAGLLRRKQFEDAAEQLQSIEQRIQDLGLPADERALLLIRRQLQVQQANLARQQNPGGKPPQSVSFEEDVAPILKEKCLGCHSNNPRGSLRLDTFAGMEAGGESGPLLVRGNPQRSLLMLRLTAPPPQRMPKDGAPLSAQELATISQWIAAGAKFDGSSKRAPIGTGKVEPKPEAIINLAKGDETVSFTKDIAPFMTNLCLRCHSGNTPRSGFSLETFEKLMQGGDSGVVVVPGELEASRMWDLVGKQDPIKMPPGQALITRTNWENLKTWIQEGARFDGQDPKASLRSLVPTEQELRMAELAKLTPQQFVDYRLERAEDMWKRVFPKEQSRFVEARETLVFGNVAADRLTQVSDWAEEQVKQLRSMFNDRESPTWKGKLTIFVVKDRFGFEEFNLVELERQTPPEVIGYAEVTAGYATAYVVLQDVGDVVDESNPGLRVNLVENLTAAYLTRGGGELPDWLVRGTGLVVAARADRGNAYVQSIPDAALLALQNLRAPEDVFANAAFAPSDVGPVGYTLVEFLLKAGGTPKFSEFVKRLQEGATAAEAAQKVYRAELRTLGVAYLNSVKR